LIGFLPWSQLGNPTAIIAYFSADFYQVYDLKMKPRKKIVVVLILCMGIWYVNLSLKSPFDLILTTAHFPALQQSA